MIPRPRPLAIAALALSTLGAAGCATSPAATDGAAIPSAVERGRQIAARECASCHAIDLSSDSPRYAAPPFREIRRRYNGASLARAFIAIGQGGHDQMPPTQISSSESAELIAFFESLGP